MRKGKDGKRFYWLKLKEDFFEDEAMEWLEEQENGSAYALFYLKLCLKALKNDGVLIRHVGDILIPYDVAKLAEFTRTNKDTVIVALELLKKIGLVEIRDDGSIFMAKLGLMVGSSADNDNAERQRRYRARLKQQKYLEQGGVTKSNASSNAVTLRLSNESIEYRDKSIESSSSTQPQQPLSEMKAIYSFYEENFSTISSFQAECLVNLKDEYSGEWVLEGMKRCVEGGRPKCNLKYLEGVLRGWKSDGIEKPWKRRAPAEDAGGQHVTYRNGVRFENGSPVIRTEDDAKRWQELKDEETRKALEEIRAQEG